MTPKLRTVDKYEPPYPLNRFPSSLPQELGREVVYLLATRKSPRIEGGDWEEIFARVIGGRWKPSNVGLDDVLLEQTAWSAKTVKSNNPHTAKTVRLVCGRNSPAYSFSQSDILSEDPSVLGGMVLSIWNERVTGVRAKYSHLRSVVLIKSEDLLDLAVFEYDTVMYDAKSCVWTWNSNKNLEGSMDGKHKFTWQPHGSQFTIIENIPPDRLAFSIRPPRVLSAEDVLKTVGFSADWVKVCGNRTD